MKVIREVGSGDGRRRLWARLGLLVSVGALLVFPVGVLVAAQGDTTRVSVASDGTQPNNSSGSPSISADGRYVTFDSFATNLVVGDSNNVLDVFVHDRQTGETARVSVDSNGSQGDGASFESVISADGRHVAFVSSASNLVSGDTNDDRDVFVHDLQTGETKRVSVSSDGTEGSHAGAGPSVFNRPSISADGRYVAFESLHDNLVAGDGNGVADVFVHDRVTGETTRVSVDSSGVEANSESGEPSISADGRYVAFISEANNLVTGVTNSVSDVFVHDRLTGATTRVSVSSDGVEANFDSLRPSISANGQYVAFESFSTNLVAGDNNGSSDVFVHDRLTGATTRVSVSSTGTEGNWASSVASISSDGRYVAFTSDSDNLVPGDTNSASDVFVHDRQTGETTRVSVASSGAEGFGASSFPAISANGRYVAFESLAFNLVPGDSGYDDVYVHQHLVDPSQPSPTTTTTTAPGTTTTAPGSPPPEGSSPSFVDTVGHLFENDIAAIAEAGITRGCNPPVNDRFCPGDFVTRGQMGAFLNRALGLASAPDQGFTDIGGSVFVGDINALAQAGITRGCNPPVNDRFCPGDFVTRGQMGAFLNRALGLASAPDQGFTDIGGSVFVGDINALAQAGITRGCNPPVNDRFCPNDRVTRGQMAAFLNRALLRD